MRYKIRYELGQIVRQFRYERHWTQSKLADTVGVSVSVIATVERNDQPGGYSLWKLRNAIPQVDEWVKKLEAAAASEAAKKAGVIAFTDSEKSPEMHNSRKYSRRSSARSQAEE